MAASAARELWRRARVLAPRARCGAAREMRSCPGNKELRGKTGAAREIRCAGYGAARKYGAAREILASCARHGRAHRLKGARTDRTRARIGELEAGVRPPHLAASAPADTSRRHIVDWGGRRTTLRILNVVVAPSTGTGKGERRVWSAAAPRQRRVRRRMLFCTAIGERGGSKGRPQLDLPAISGRRARHGAGSSSCRARRRNSRATVPATVRRMLPVRRRSCPCRRRGSATGPW